jgi:hypothetical protein
MGIYLATRLLGVSLLQWRGVRLMRQRRQGRAQPWTPLTYTFTYSFSRSRRPSRRFSASTRISTSDEGPFPSPYAFSRRLSFTY